MDLCTALALVIVLMIVCCSRPHTEGFYNGSVWPGAAGFPLYGQTMTAPLPGGGYVMSRAGPVNRVQLTAGQPTISYERGY